MRIAGRAGVRIVPLGLRHMDPTSIELERRDSIRFLQTALALLALAGVSLALLVHAFAAPLGLAVEAAQAVTTAFLALACLDALLLLVWERVVRLLGGT